jgi:hypothetical protein
MILLKSWLFELIDDHLHVFNCRPDKVNRFEMKKFLCGFFYLLNQVNIVLIEFGLCVND